MRGAVVLAHAVAPIGIDLQLSDRTLHESAGGEDAPMDDEPLDRTLRLRDGWAVYRMRVQAAEALRRLPPAPGGPGAAPERAGR